MSAATPVAVLLLPVVLQRAHENRGRVVAAGGVVRERRTPVAVLLMPVVLFSSATSPSAVLLLPVVLLGSALRADSGIALAGCQVKKRIITLGGIAAGIASVGCRNNPESSRGRRKCKRTKRKRDENESGPRTENREK